MDNNLLEKLKKIAIRFHIDPKETIGHAAKVDTIIKVLSDINKSYKNYLEVEFKKNDGFYKAYENNSKLLETFLNDLDLFAVDLNFSSFDISVAPNIIENQSSIFTDEVLEWKKSSFSDYKELITGDFREPSYMKSVSEKYSDVERRKIYKPLFNSIGTSYAVNIKNTAGKVIRTLQRPSKEKIKFYLPRIANEEKEIPVEKDVLVYMKMKKVSDDMFDIKKRNIQQIYYVEELDHETYPFTPDYIEFDDKMFFLDKALACDVSYEDENYVITNKELGLTVWGETRLEAEEAFSFSFYSLFLNFYEEEDKNLSNKAQELKQKLRTIIKEVVNEA